MPTKNSPLQSDRDSMLQLLAVLPDSVVRSGLFHRWNQNDVVAWKEISAILSPFIRLQLKFWNPKLIKAYKQLRNAAESLNSYAFFFPSKKDQPEILIKQLREKYNALLEAAHDEQVNDKTKKLRLTINIKLRKIHREGTKYSLSYTGKRWEMISKLLHSNKAVAASKFTENNSKQPYTNVTDSKEEINKRFKKELAVSDDLIIRTAGGGYLVNREAFDIELI